MKKSQSYFALTCREIIQCVFMTRKECRDWELWSEVDECPEKHKIIKVEIIRR